MLHQAFNIHAVHAKRGACFRHTAYIGFGQLCCCVNHAHAASTATAHGLDDDGRSLRASLLRGKKNLRLCQTHGVIETRHQGHMLRQGQLARTGLVAKQGQVGRRWADKAQIGRCTGHRKVGPFTQEPVTWMHCVAAGSSRNGHQVFGVQVRGRPRRIQGNGLVCCPHMQGICIVLRVHRDTGNLLVVRSPDKSNGDLASVRYQYLLDHQMSFRTWHITLSAPPVAASLVTADLTTVIR